MDGAGPTVKAAIKATGRGCKTRPTNSTGNTVIHNNAATERRSHPRRCVGVLVGHGNRNAVIPIGKEAPDDICLV